MRKIAAACLLTGLAGCAIGIQDSSPQVSYEVDKPYRTVYARALDQANECLRGDGTFNGRQVNFDLRQSAFDVKDHLDAGAGQGEITVNDPLTGTVVARTSFRSLGANRTEVTQTVSGKGSWDGKTLHAMQQSILMDASVCTVYKVGK